VTLDLAMILEYNTKGTSNKRKNKLHFENKKILCIKKINRDKGKIVSAGY
jgi:hypothetical protein